MSATSRLLEIFAIMRPLMQGAAVRRAVPKIGLVIVLSVMAGVLGAVVMVLGLYALYVTLTLHEMAPLDALLIILAMAMGVLLALLLWMRQCVRSIKRQAIPSPGNLLGILDAFMDGLRTPNSRE